MRRTSLAHVTVLAVCAGVATVALAQQTPERVTVAFSDPSRLGTLRIALVQGSITVKGTDRKDVLVEARTRANGKPLPQRETAAGLRRLGQGASMNIEEQNNVMSIGTSTVNRTVDFAIQVPTRTNLRLSTVNNGNILVDTVEGELEIEIVNGSISMTNVAGSIVANSVNGRVMATMTRVTSDKPMAFTSVNGHIDVTLPSSVKTNLKLRSDMGDVFTDFDVQIRPATSAPSVQDTRFSAGRGGRLRMEVDKFIYGAVNGGGPEFEMRTFNGNVYVRKSN